MLGPSAVGPDARRFSTRRPVLACWLVVAVFTTLPFAKAAFFPPAGRTFVGTFHWIDDFHNYVSFVQQAEDGHFVFENKLRLDDHPRTLVNLEWWLVGTASSTLGRSPFLAYRVLALGLFFGLLHAADRALRRGGLPKAHRFPALLLIGLGGGLGGLLFELTPRTVERCADLWFGLYPFMQALGNPHWLAGTWLALETLLALEGTTSRRSHLAAAALGTALGLVRPYDLVLVVAVFGITVCICHPPRDWLRRLAPLAGLLPVALYNYWVFYRLDTFSTYTGTAYGMPPVSDLLWGLGPAALAASLALWPLPREAGPRRLRVLLVVWATLAVVTLVAKPVAFALQFAVGSGLPLLVLGALGLSRARPRVLLAIALLSASTAVVALRIVLRPDPNWHVPAERRQAALVLRAHCRPRDLVFSPADIGLYVNALTSCRAYLSHGWAPGYAERRALVQAFYSGMAQESRRALLDRLLVTKIVLPGDAGPTAAGWLGDDSVFAQVALIPGLAGGVSVYSRESDHSRGRTAK